MAAIPKMRKEEDSQTVSEVLHSFFKGCCISIQNKGVFESVL